MQIKVKGSLRCREAYLLFESLSIKEIPDYLVFAAKCLEPMIVGYEMPL
jgi:hypothetical protein